MNISICITTCNRPKLLKETLNSCVNQTFKPFEIIIGDDSNNNLTKNMISEYNINKSINVRYYQHFPPLGQANNVNFIFQKALGEKLILMHDDDLLLPKASEKLIEVFKLDPNIKVAFGKSYLMSEDGTIDYRKSGPVNSYFFKDKKYEGSKLSSTEAGIIQQFPNNGYMINTKLAKSIPWRTKTTYAKLGTGCEYDFGLRLGLTNNKMYFINEYLVKYRINSVSNSTSPTNDDAYKSYLILKNTKIHPKFEKIKGIALKRKAAYGIVQALNLGQYHDAVNMFFSKYHIKLCYTPGFYYRLILIVAFWFKQLSIFNSGNLK